MLPLLMAVQYCGCGLVGMTGINGRIPWCRHLAESANFNYKLLCAIMHSDARPPVENLFKLLLLLHSAASLVAHRLRPPTFSNCISLSIGNYSDFEGR